MCLTHLFLKIDMHFTDPVGRVHPPNHPDPWRHPPKFANKGFVGSHLRKTLLAERSLTPLWRVLRGWTWDPREPAVEMDRLDIFKLWARHYYHPTEDLEDEDDLEAQDRPEDQANQEVSGRFEAQSGRRAQGSYPLPSFMV